MEPTHHIPTTDDRVITADESGVPDGRPVLLLPSAPGSRRFDPDPAATTAAGIRLITTDRPGYGASPAEPNGSVPSWTDVAHDHVALLAALGLERLHVVGWSNGGIAALAMAALAPRSVERVTIVGTPAPDDIVPWLPPEHRAMVAELKKVPEAAMDALAPAFAAMAEQPAAAIGAITAGEADARLLRDPAVHERLVAMLAEAFAAGTGGVAADIVRTQVAPWGFDPATIDVPVELVYGARDPIVPPAHGEHYASAIPAARLRTVEDAGHLVVIDDWPAIIAERAPIPAAPRA